MRGILYEGDNEMKRFVCLLLIMAMLMSLGYSVYAQNEGAAVRDEESEYEEFKKKVVGKEIHLSSRTTFYKGFIALRISDYFSEGIKYKKGSATLTIKCYVDGKSYNISDIVPGLKTLNYTEKSGDGYVDIEFESDLLEKLRNIDDELVIEEQATVIIQESAIVKDGVGGYSLSYGSSGGTNSKGGDFTFYDSYGITVVWDDDNDRDGLRPSGPIYLELRGARGKSLYKVIKAPQRPTSEQELKFTNVQPGFKEDKLSGQPVDEYKISSVKNYDGSYVLTYKHVPAKVDIPVSIEWDDNDNELGKRPDSVKVDIVPASSNNSTRAAITALAQNREAQDEDIVGSTDNWSKTFEKYKYDNGSEIEYKVDAQDVEGYKKEITKTGNVYNIKYT